MSQIPMGKTEIIELILRYVQATHISDSAKRNFIAETLDKVFEAGQDAPKND